ncbi:hypothetical protein [Novosphingobium kaempferiae]|uniref:hypothetical protein n=1 Tax=Novosphingobium kaempferiae TaxID=2896849 RepID=UPI001E537729|nr:hypothetical protein [Novosphingobium kaempferiae]
MLAHGGSDAKKFYALPWSGEDLPPRLARSLTAGVDGTRLHVGISSDSNVEEHGMALGEERPSSGKSTSP